ncbi:alpha/beta fold hydrolase [Streptomyces sp. TRM75563]|uniref:alpha/beta fold hydrolase n=1 Tax=Streptomyces sp. TRM75563 TaxID=2817418 RepID=UPI0024164942|nr:alpha/beta fold hydrolase [Streptomyces sp. TRM75563]
MTAGGGDGLETMAPLGKAVSKKSRVCSYDRLGEGASDRPDGPQSIDDSSAILTSVLGRLAGDRPVALAGHSPAGHLAARYAPGHPDRIKDLVLLDATVPTLTAGISRTIPASATGVPAQLRAQAIVVNKVGRPEQLVIADGEVRPAGDIPVEILQHASQWPW